MKKSQFELFAVEYVRDDQRKERLTLRCFNATLVSPSNSLPQILEPELCCLENLSQFCLEMGTVDVFRHGGMSEHVSDRDRERGVEDFSENSTELVCACHWANCRS